MDWPDFSMPEIEWHPTAAALAVGTCLLLASFMFSDNFGWSNYPLVYKIIIIGLGLPVWYYVALLMINKE